MDIRKILNVEELRARKKGWFGVGVILCLCNTIAESRQKDSHSNIWLLKTWSHFFLLSFSYLFKVGSKIG